MECPSSQILWPKLRSDTDDMTAALRSLFHQFEWFVAKSKQTNVNKVFVLVNNCLDEKGVCACVLCLCVGVVGRAMMWSVE